MRLLSLWILAALPALAAPKEGSWLTLPSGRAVCVSPVPAAGKLKKPEREAYEAVVADLLAGKDAATIGRELSVNPTEHPWVDSLAVAAGVAAATPDADRAVALAEAWPADPCLAATAAVALVLRDGEGVDGAKVEDLAGRAWLPLPHPDLGYALAVGLLAQGELERAKGIVDRWLQTAPDHGDLIAVRAHIGMQLGEGGEVLDALLARHLGGDHRMDVALRDGLYRDGRMGDYLRVVAGMGGPLGGARPAVLTAADPMAALLTHLGVIEAGQVLEARIETSMGPITCELFPEVAPVTVANFVGLARGDQDWTTPMGTPGDGPLYPGTIFHRVIPGFMIQGGDPLGDGSGGPGYAFHDEVDGSVRFDQPGRLAMANAGPGTNGSQFFVTVGRTSHLDGRHTIFGQCGPLELVDRIAGVPRNAADVPVRPVTIDAITVEARQPTAP